MSGWKYVRAAWDATVPATLPSGEGLGVKPSDCKLVLLALTAHADADGVCWPGVQRLVIRTQLSERTVQRALQALQALGWINVEAYAHGGRARTTEYTLLLDVAELSTGSPGNLLEQMSNPVRQPGYPPSNPAQGTGFPAIPRTKPRPIDGKPRNGNPPSAQSSNETAPTTPMKYQNSHRERSRPPGDGSPAATAAVSQPSEVAPDRDHRTPRTTTLREQLSARLTPSTADPGEQVFGFLLTEVHEALAREPGRRQIELEKFARWLAKRGAVERVIRAAVAYSIMNQIANPFAYFAAGQAPRAAIEAWAATT